MDQVVVGWYDEQIGELKGRSSLGVLSRAARLRRQQQLLMAERLYYQFDANPGKISGLHPPGRGSHRRSRRGVGYLAP